MKNLSVEKLKPLIAAYLKERPAFMSLIRPQEAFLFDYFSKYRRGRVLDFGCGDGFFAQVAFHEKKIDIGLEVEGNPRIVEARERSVYKKIILYDGAVIPLKNNSVDSVISNCVFEHISNISASVKEIARVLKPGGYCATSVMTSNWSNMMLGSSLFGKRYAAWMNRRQVHESLLSKKQWETLFKEAGFKIVEEVGYVNETTAKWLDVFHYLSLPSLASYALFKKWNLFSSKSINKFLGKWIYSELKKDINSSQSSAVFFVLKK